LPYNSIQLDEFCKKHGFIGWFETSAKSDINIDSLLFITYYDFYYIKESVNFLLKTILEIAQKMIEKDEMKNPGYSFLL
jgi:hypothetical protein